MLQSFNTRVNILAFKSNPSQRWLVFQHLVFPVWMIFKKMRIQIGVPGASFLGLESLISEKKTFTASLLIFSRVHNLKLRTSLIKEESETGASKYSGRETTC